MGGGNLGSLDALIRQVADPVLRGRLVREVQELADRRTFGLVFEKHLPEIVRLPQVPVRRGSYVTVRGDSAEVLWKVVQLTEGEASLRADDGASMQAQVEILVAARRFGQAVYPGLRATGAIRRGGDKPHHLVINGENHHALEALRYTHSRAVDCIYIDPPYNTGGDFAYNDKFVGKDDDYRHSKWLSFMEKRLKIAHDLLKLTGVMIVAIDDNEQARLKLLMDQIFKPQNFLATIIWQGGRKNDSRYVSVGHDYMLLFARDEKSLRDAGVRWREPRPADAATREAASRAWSEGAGDPAAATKLMKEWIASLPVGHPAKTNNRFYEFEPDGRVFRKRDVSWPGGGGPTYDVLHPVTGLPVKVPSRGWIYADQKRMQQDIDAGLIMWGASHNDYINRKTYLDDGPGAVPASVFEKKRTSAAKALTKILGSQRFKFPKDHEVLARWIGAVCGPQAVVLDFFAGSGSTAQAVMELNASDGGRRQCILVTNNEVDEKTAQKLTDQGFVDGDPAWEEWGIYQRVTRPRIQAITTGLREDGSTYSHGLDENVTFLDLTYLDRTDVERGQAFSQVAYLLWAQAGARGAVIEEREESFSAPTDATYAILFNVDHWRPFAAAVREADQVTHAFIVTDSDSAFATAAAALPDRLTVKQLYENYLSTFEINTGEA